MKIKNSINVYHICCVGRKKWIINSSQHDGLTTIDWNRNELEMN